MPKCSRAIRLSRIHIYALAMCSLLGAKPAAAAAFSASFGYPLKAVQLQGGAIENGEVITFSNSGSQGIQINFLLPRDYQKDSQVRIVFYFTVNVGTPCRIRFVATGMRRKRVGSVLVTDQNGLSSSNAVVSFSVPNTVVQKVFVLQPGGLLPGQNRGDAFTITFVRDAENATDTCAGSTLLHGIDIQYTPVP